MGFNYFLCRKVDMALIRAGKQAITCEGNKATLIGELPLSDSDESVAWSVEGKNFIQLTGKDGRYTQDNGYSCNIVMAPLHWIEGKPVYKGDHLYFVGEDFDDDTVDHIVSHFSNGKLYDITDCYAKDEFLSWIKPKRVRVVAHIGCSLTIGHWAAPSMRRAFEQQVKDANVFYGEGTHWVEDEGVEQDKPKELFINFYGDSASCYATQEKADINASSSRKTGKAVKVYMPA